MPVEVSMIEYATKPLRVYDYAYLTKFIYLRLTFDFLPDLGKQPAIKEQLKPKAKFVDLTDIETQHLLSNLLKISMDLLQQAYGVSDDKIAHCYQTLLTDLQTDLCDKPTEDADKLLQELKARFLTEECLDEQDYNFVLGSACLKTVTIVAAPSCFDEEALKGKPYKVIDLEGMFDKAIKIISMDGLDPKDRFPVSIDTQCFLDTGYMSKIKKLAKKLGNEELKCLHEFNLNEVNLDDVPGKVRTTLNSYVEKYRYLFCSDLFNPKTILLWALKQRRWLKKAYKSDKAKYLSDELFLLSMLIAQTAYAATSKLGSLGQAASYYPKKLLNRSIEKLLNDRRNEKALASSPMFYALYFTEHKLMPALAEYRKKYIK